MYVVWSFFIIDWKLFENGKLVYRNLISLKTETLTSFFVTIVASWMY